ncbi:hypothetical protein EON66_07205, partial [archaeon]
ALLPKEQRGAELYILNDCLTDAVFVRQSVRGPAATECIPVPSLPSTSALDADGSAHSAGGYGPSRVPFVLDAPGEKDASLQLCVRPQGIASLFYWDSNRVGRDILRGDYLSAARRLAAGALGGVELGACKEGDMSNGFVSSCDDNSMSHHLSSCKHGGASGNGVWSGRHGSLQFGLSELGHAERIVVGGVPGKGKSAGGYGAVTRRVITISLEADMSSGSSRIVRASDVPQPPLARLQYLLTRLADVRTQVTHANRLLTALHRLLDVELQKVTRMTQLLLDEAESRVLSGGAVQVPIPSNVQRAHTLQTGGAPSSGGVVQTTSLASQLQVGNVVVPDSVALPVRASGSMDDASTVASAQPADAAALREQKGVPFSIPLYAPWRSTQFPAPLVERGDMSPEAAAAGESLWVQVVSGVDMPIADRDGFSDCFVVLSLHARLTTTDAESCTTREARASRPDLNADLGPQLLRKETRYCAHTCDPVWGEAFIFQLPSPAAAQAQAQLLQLPDCILRARLFDFDRTGTRTLLGEVRVSLQACDLHTVYDGWYPLSWSEGSKLRPRGSVRLRLVRTAQWLGGPALTPLQLRAAVQTVEAARVETVALLSRVSGVLHDHLAAYPHHAAHVQQ